MKKIALLTAGKLPGDAVCEPLQLGYLAAYLKQRGISVTIIDRAAGDNIEAELARFAPDYVGVTATTPLVNEAYRILAYCRKQGYTTILGGVHASTMPEEAKQFADYVVVGEGENALYSILTERPPHGIIRGAHIQNIDDIPFPDRSLMNMEFYIREKLREPVNIYYFLPRGTRTAALITSRGCPHDCTFCHNSWRGTPFRQHSAERVFSEIAGLKNTYNAGALFFMDDDLFISKPRILELCKKLEQAKLNLLWSGNARVSSVDKEVLAAAYRAGCRQINYGMESGSQNVVDTLKKGTTIQQAEEAIALTKEAGILVSCSFMIGTPGETREDIKKTKEFIFTHPLDTLSLSVTTPYPGTALWDYCKAHNRIPASLQWDDFGLSSGGISAHEFFSREQLVKMRSRIMIEVFLRSGIKYALYYMRYPAYTLGKLREAIRSLLGLKPPVIHLKKI